MRMVRGPLPIFPCFPASLALAAAALLASAQPPQTGEHVPAFTLPAVRGDSLHFSGKTPQLVLLAFLQTVPDSAPTASRRQVALLESMDRQYRARGVRVAIVDATASVTGKQPPHDSLINASYDWNLDIPLLEDDAGRVAKMLGVSRAPTTILIGADGRIVRVWDREMAPGELAVAIETSLGSGPLDPRSATAASPK